jgi:hypothetical protein
MTAAEEYKCLTTAQKIAACEDALKTYPPEHSQREWIVRQIERLKGVPHDPQSRP